MSIIIFPISMGLVEGLNCINDINLDENQGAKNKKLRLLYRKNTTLKVNEYQHLIKTILIWEKVSNVLEKKCLKDNKF